MFHGVSAGSRRLILVRVDQSLCGKTGHSVGYTLSLEDGDVDRAMAAADVNRAMAATDEIEGRLCLSAGCRWGTGYEPEGGDYPLLWYVTQWAAAACSWARRRVIIRSGSATPLALGAGRQCCAWLAMLGRCFCERVGRVETSLEAGLGWHVAGRQHSL